MQTEWNENRIVLHGRVCQAPVPSHTNHGESYLKFPLAVCRLSGAEDRVNVVASAALLERCPLTEGEELSVEGEVRSFNNRSGVGSRLVISVYARQMHREPGEEENRLRLTGTLCKVPVYRRTPLGRDICDLMLAVNRHYGRSDYLPCITWGARACETALWDVGTRVSLEGRLQKALELLDGGLSVSETAMRCGFNSPNYFCKNFREEYGRAPSAYRSPAR